MIVTYTKLLQAPIIEIKNQTLLGTLSDIVFNKTNFKIAGVLVRINGFTLTGKPWVVSESDVVEISRQAIIVQDNESLTELKNTIRIKEAAKEGYRGISQRVYTRGGKRIGVVHDLYIDTESHMVVRLLIKGVFSERLISTSNILEVKGKKIIVRDDFETTKEGSPAFAQSLI